MSAQDVSIRSEAKELELGKHILAMAAADGLISTAAFLLALWMFGPRAAGTAGLVTLAVGVVEGIGLLFIDSK